MGFEVFGVDAEMFGLKSAYWRANRHTSARSEEVYSKGDILLSYVLFNMSRPF